MKNQIIDLSKTISYNQNDPWFMRIKIKHKQHHKSKFLIRWFLGLPQKLFPNNFEGWADDTIKNMGVHAATHLDAPWHYGPTCEGKKAKTIDEVPLEWCYADGVVLNFTHKKDHEVITKLDIENELLRINYHIKPMDIVLIYTGRDQYLGTKEYPHKGTGMSAEATKFIIEKGVKIMGIDQWGFDLPLKFQTQKAISQNDKNLFWEAHRIGIEHEYCHMEQLTNLGKLPSYGFKICVFPLKIKGASAAPARVVALLNS